MKTRELKICEFNIENLFIGMEYYAGQSFEKLSELDWKEIALAQLQDRQKPLHKVLGAAKAIAEIAPDILMLTEVGGRDSLENFNRHFLGDRFTPYFIEGNSRRGIDLAFLVAKDLPYRVEALSNKNTPVRIVGPRGPYTTQFSRDVAELRLYEGESLKLIALLVHFKSKLSTEDDINGKDARTAEAIATTRLYEERRRLFPDVPIVLGGDFNAELASLELEALRRSDLTDFHDLLGTPREARVSLVHFDYVDNAYPLILDYLLLSPQLKECVVAAKSYTYRYKGFYDLPERFPQSRRERFQMPSDHYPVVLTLTLTETR